MENKNLNRARLLSRIGGFIIVGAGAILVLFSMIRPFNVTYNDQHYYMTLWQMVEYPSIFWYMLGTFLGFIMFGIAGLLISKRLKTKTKATNTLGISLMILGFFTFPIVGAGIFYFIAGIQTLLAKKVQEFQSLS